MKGLDTNILVRYLVADDKNQAEKASACIRETTASGDLCFINHIVLCELVWVLETAYGYPRKEIVDVLERLLITKQFEIDSRDIVWQAVHDYRNSKGDIADYIIGRINHMKGCDVTATFDLSLKSSAFFSLID